MINLFKYITEAYFSSANFSHQGKYDYITAVLDDIINGKPIGIGETSIVSKYQPTPEEIEACKNFNPIKSTSKDFDKIFNGKLKWTKIFKGTYSGYINGTDHNKGNLFEKIFAQHFHDDYQEGIEKCMNVKPGTLDDYKADPSYGKKNQKRPLISKNNQLLVSGFQDTVGKSVVDVKLVKPGSSPEDGINLSLKWDNTITFVNSGIGKIFSRRSFNNYITNGGIYTPNCVNGLDGQLILDTFCIDNNMFANTFINYVEGRKKIKNDGIDITNKINKKIIINLLYSVVGYDFILVHAFNKKTEYVDLRQKSDMIKFIGHSIKKVTLYYGGRGTTSKQVDIVVELNDKQMRFSMRSTSGGIYPDKFLVYYENLR